MHESLLRRSTLTAGVMDMSEGLTLASSKRDRLSGRLAVGRTLVEEDPGTGRCWVAIHRTELAWLPNR